MLLVKPCKLTLSTCAVYVSCCDNRHSCAGNIVYDNVTDVLRSFNYSSINVFHYIEDLILGNITLRLNRKAGLVSITYYKVLVTIRVGLVTSLRA